MQKKWFNSQLCFWGRNAIHVLNPLLSTMKSEVNDFINRYDEMIKKYIHD